MANWNEIPLDAVAIIGAAGRFPKAQSLESLWDAIKDGRNCTDTVSSEALKADGVPDAELGTDEYITAMGRLDDVFSFDALRMQAMLLTKIHAELGFTHHQAIVAIFHPAFKELELHE